MLLILMQGLNTVKLFRKYKSEQMDELKAEREALESERIKSQEMMAELLKLKEQMGMAANTAAAAPVATENGDNSENADSHRENGSEGSAEIKEMKDGDIRND